MLGTSNQSVPETTSEYRENEVLICFNPLEVGIASFRQTHMESS